MEPIFFPGDERVLLPPELHLPPKSMDSTSNLEARRRQRDAKVAGEDKDVPSAGVDGGGSGVGGGGGEQEIERRGERRGKLPYDRHSLHVVTQYYIPDDPSRAREVGGHHIRRIWDHVMHDVRHELNTYPLM